MFLSRVVLENATNLETSDVKFWEILKVLK